MQTGTDLSVLLRRLCEVGEKPPRKLFDDVPRHGEDAIAALIGIVADYPVDDPDADDRRHRATYHAVRLLGELRAAEAVGPLLALLDLDDD